MRVSVNTKAVERLFARSEQVGEAVVEEAYQYFHALTPRGKTGNAKNSTKLDKANKTIEADYPYAGVLDAGRRMTSSGMRGSQQAPNGMSGPTLKEIDRIVKREIGKL